MRNVLIRNGALLAENKWVAICFLCSSVMITGWRWCLATGSSRSVMTTSSLSLAPFVCSEHEKLFSIKEKKGWWGMCGESERVKERAKHPKFTH